MTETQATYSLLRTDGRYAADFIEQQAKEIETEIALRRKAEQGLVDWRVKYTELQAKLSAMEKQEPAGEVRQKIGSDAGSFFVLWRKQVHPGDKLFTAPKVAQPLTDEQVEKIVDDHTADDGGYDIWCNGRAVARAIEAAHNIGGQQP